MSQRSYVAGVHVVLGMTDVVVDVVSVRKPGVKVQFRQICPSCEEPTRPGQRYLCPSCEGLFEPRDLDRAKEEDGLLFRFSDEEIAEVKAAAEPDEDTLKKLVLNVCPLDELHAATRPGDNAYRLRLPQDAKQQAFYNVLGHAAGSTKYGLYGLLRLKEDDTPQAYRLDVWNGQIVLQSLIRPQDLAEVDQEVGDPGKFREMTDAVLESMNGPFNADALADGRRAKLDEIIAGKDVLAAVPTIVKTEEGDLLATLEASLAALKERAA